MLCSLFVFLSKFSAFRHSEARLKTSVPYSLPSSEDEKLGAVRVIRPIYLLKNLEFQCHNLTKNFSIEVFLASIFWFFILTARKRIKTLPSVFCQPVFD